MVVRSASLPSSAWTKAMFQLGEMKLEFGEARQGLSRYRYASFALLQRLDQAMFQLGEMKLEFGEARQG